jgi:hypothetical protein
MLRAVIAASARWVPRGSDAEERRILREYQDDNKPVKEHSVGGYKSSKLLN